MRYRRRPTLALLAAFAAATAGGAAQPAAAATATSCAGTAADATFFTNPSLGATSLHGEIVRCKRVTLTDNGLPAGTRGYQVVYRGENASGGAIPVSSTIFVPSTGGSQGIISLASGTIGMADTCAPSAGLPDGSAFVSGTAARYLEQGFTVAVTDYEGLGTSLEHPYLNGRSAGRALIDGARATTRLPGESQLANSKALFTGYSQGGHATLWAAQLTPLYAGSLSVAGAVAGAAPVNIEAVRASLDGALASGLLSYLIKSLMNQYPELGLSAKLSSSGTSFVNNYSSVCSVSTAANPGSWFRSWSNLWKSGQDPLNDQAFRDRLDENNVSSWGPLVPTYVFHGDNDGIVPIGPAQTLVQSWINWGYPAKFKVVPGSHLWSTNANGQETSLNWIRARFGLPADPAYPPNV